MNDVDYDISAPFYDHVVPYRDRHEDVRFYVDEARKAAGPVLELGCGTGRVLLPVARAGAAITGLDRSRAMLSVARDKLAREPGDVRARVRLVEGSMQSFDLDRRFSLVTIPFRAFSHLLTVDEQLECLATVHRHLEPGGCLAFDLFNPMLEMLVDERRSSEWGDEPEFTMPDGARVLRRFRVTRCDRPRQIQYLEMIFYVTDPDGSTRRLVEGFSLRHFFRYEVEHLLARCAFVDVRIDADFEGTPFGDTYPGEIVVRARRPLDGR